MPASVRDILLLIRTKEDASRAINNVAQSMRKAGAAAEAASLRAQAAQRRQMAAQALQAGATQAQVAALRNEAKALDDQAKKVEYVRKRQNNLGHAMQNVARITEIAGVAMIGLGVATIAGLGDAVQAASDWDKQVRLTYTQVDKRFKPSLKELGEIGLRVAKDIAVPFEEVQTALFDVFSSTEANLPQAEALLRSFSKAAVAGQTDIQTASRATIGVMNAYKIPFEDVNKVLDIQFQLVQEGVGTYEEWAQRIGLVTPSAVRAGQSFETMAAALATVTRMGVSAARGGTAVARAFDAMSNPKTEKALAEIGVKTRDAKGNFRPLVDVLTDWRKQLDSLPPKERVAEILDVLKGAGSTIEARRFLQGILLTKGGLELFQDQIKEFATDKGAFQKAYDEMANSVSAKTQLLKNAWMTLKVSIGTALLPTFTMLVGKLQQILDWFNKLSPGAKNTIAQFLLWGAVLSIVIGVITVILGAIVGLLGVITIAGPALAPMIAAFASVAAIVAGVILVITALGAAFIVAYQKSAAFRAVVSSIGDTLGALWGAIKTAASTVGSAISTTMGPAFTALWNVIETKVLPAAKEFIDWCRTNLVPIIQQAGAVFAASLQPALKMAADAIQNYLVPAISDVVDWFKQNKDAILPVIRFLAQMMIGGAALAGVIVGVLIAALAASARATVVMGRTLVNIFRTAYTYVRTQINIGIAAIKAIIGFFKDLGSKASSAMATVKTTVKSAIDSVKGAFKGASSWLINAGRDIVNGLIAGIREKIGAAAAEAANLAKAALGAAKDALGIHSPSRHFKDIGANVVRGFIEGVKVNAKKIRDTMFALKRDIQRSIAGAGISKRERAKLSKAWNRLIDKNERKLLALDAKRTKLQNRLADATKSYNDQLKARNDLQQKIAESLQDANDLTTLTDVQKQTAGGIAAGLKDRLMALKTFQADLLKLQARGFDKQTIADLATQGVEAGGALAHTLANASQQDLNQISSVQQQIREISGSMGSTIADSLYKAGIDAAKGLMDGLSSQIKKITAEMTNIANALVAAIKKQLGIHSPSTVFAALGSNTALGYINGYMADMNAAKNRMAMASMFTPAAPLNGPYAAMPYADGTPHKVINNNITVNTQEIDPRKTSADLGWELAGQM